MLSTRVIPCLLLSGDGFVKTTRFGRPVYLGDPLNILRIFNEKEADEMIVLDILVGRENKEPNYSLIEDMASECFMPLCYGGGVRTVEQIRRIFGIGIEKVAINTAAFEDAELIDKAAREFGSQSIVVSIDVKKGFFGKYDVLLRSGSRKTGRDPVSYAKELEKRGAGEILINSIDRDGTMEGYDLELVKSIAAAVDVPVIACGGARNVDDFYSAVTLAGASAVAAGSMFVFQGRHRAVLINMPGRTEIDKAIAGADPASTGAGVTQV